jgi:patatin-like phospholipase/acyl hydrolase
MATKILSIDGGGIRGIIPATVLDHIERQTGRPTAELFDTIAGTSTGGIIALGLTCPGDDGGPKFTAAEIVDLYVRHGPTIFPHELFGKIRQFFEEKYPDDGLNAALEEELGQARLKQSLTNLLVTAYDIEKRKPVFFRSARAREDEEHDFAMRDVARATSAAPTYFEPAGALIDGGVFATNPGMCAFVDAYAGKARAADTIVVSLGTGSNTRPLSVDAAKGWGLAGWARHILDVVFDGVSDTVDYQLSQILGDTYFRLQTVLDKANDDMDDASAKNLENLKEQGKELVERESAKLDEICRLLVA